MAGRDAIARELANALKSAQRQLQDEKSARVEGFRGFQLPPALTICMSCGSVMPLGNGVSLITAEMADDSYCMKHAVGACVQIGAKTCPSVR